MKKKFLGVLVLGLFVMASSAAFAAPAEEASAPKKDPEKVLAKVETQEIKEKDIDQVIQMIGPQGAMMYDNEQGRKAILDELVAARLFSLMGAKQGLDKTPEFKEALANFASQALAKAAIENSLKDVAVPDEDTKKFYDGNPEQFTTPEEIRVRHILVSDDVTSADTIKLVQAELKKGTSFDVLAQKHSICPSAPQGGDLGFFGKGQMVPEFEEVAFAMKNLGDVSDPVKTSFGWHIIMLEEKKPSATMGYDEVKLQISQYLANEKKAKKYQEELESLKKEYKVEMFLPKEEAPVSPDKK